MTESNCRSLGAYLRELRGERRIVDVAARMGVSAAFLSKVECGKNAPTFSRLEAMLDALGANPEQRQAAYVAFERLPPEVAERLRSVPEAWNLRFSLVLDALRAIGSERDKLSPATRQKIAAALGSSRSKAA